MKSSKFQPCLLKQFLKIQKSLYDLEYMHYNTIYTCISWYTKNCWFSVKKCWCQQNSMGVSRDLCIFWIFFRYGITVPSFINVQYVWQILERGGILSPPFVSSPEKPILKRFKTQRSESKNVCVFSIVLFFKGIMTF